MNAGEEHALRYALSRGILNAQQISAARAEASATPGGASALSLLRSQLEPAQLAELSQVYQQAQSSFSAGQTLAPPAHPEVAQPRALTPPPAPATAPGADTLGPYVIVRELARGGMGVVYVARRPGMEREVALKVLLSGEGASAGEILRFMSEVKITSRLEHPNVIRIYDTGQQGGQHYFAMDLVDGPSLERLILSEGPLPPRRAAEITAKLARALAYAHERAVLHRDLKPHNVLLRSDGEPILTDFGIAKDVGAATGLTQDGDIVGTPAYMPPEQTGGELEVVDRRSDVYSLGATLFHLLLGRAPFAGDTLVSLITHVLRDPAPSPRALRPEVDLDLDTIVLKCLEKEQDQRYLTMSALAEDLERYVRDEPISARPPTFSERLRKWIRRNRALASVSATAAALLLLAAGAAGLWVARAERAKRRAELNQQQEAERVQAGLIHAARLRALESQAKLKVPTSEALGSLNPEERRAAIDSALSAAMRAAQDAQLWRGLAPEDRAAIQHAAETGRGLGEVALLGEQWSLAAEAFEQVRALGLDPQRSQRDVARVQEARTAEARRQREAVQAVLARAEQGELRQATRGLESAVFELLRYPQAQTSEVLAEALTGVTSRLLEVRRELYLQAARPRELEARAGARPIPELPEAVQRRLAADPLEPLKLSASDRSALAAAHKLIKRRAGLGLGAREAFERVLALEQRSLPPGVIDLGRLCARALGRLGHVEASAALARYLDACGIEEQATEAAFSLILLGDPRGVRAVQRASSRFSISGPFRRQIQATVGMLQAPDGDTRFARATRLLSEAKGAQALALFQELTQENPQDVPTLIGLAQAYVQAGQRQQALVTLQRAEELAPGHVAPARIQAAIYRFEGNLEEAQRYAKLAVSRAPRDAQARTELGWAQLQGSLVKEAEVSARAALAIDEECSDAHVLMGFLHLAHQDPGEARASLQRAATFNPHDTQALTGLAKVELSEGKLQPALALAEKALRLNPSDLVAHVLKGEILSLMGRGADAERELSAALRVIPGNTEALVLRGFVLAGLNRVAESEADFKRAAEIDATDPELWVQWGNACQVRGASEQALERYARALKLNPNYLEALVRRAELFRSLKRYDAAKRDLERARRAAPQNLHVLYGLTALLFSSGDLDEAARVADQMVRIAPESPRPYLARGTVSTLRQDYAVAERDLQQAVKLGPDNSLAWHRLGTAQLRQHKFQQARQSLDEALQRNPRDPDTWLNRGRALARLGEHRAAIKDFDQAYQLFPDTDSRWERAISLMHLGAREEAVTAFEPLAPEDAYAAVWIAGAGGGSAALQAHAKGADWINEVVRYFLDQVDEAKLLEDAASEAGGKAEGQAGRLCEAHAYIGLRAEREGQPAKALKHYRASLATGKRSYVEFDWARARAEALAR